MPDSETPEHRDASLDEVGSRVSCCRQLCDGSSEHRERPGPEGDEQAVLGAEQRVHGAGGSAHIIGEPPDGQPFQAVVGHSIGGVIATAYAAQHPTRGVINVDQPLQVAPFAALVQSVADKLRGPAFPAVWQMFAASMHIELLPEAAQVLVRSSGQPRQDLVLAYWREVLDRPVSEIASFAAATLEAVRSAGVPYLVVAGADLEPEYHKWLSKTLPQAAITVWPASGHFPHIAYPGRFAQCLAATGRPSGRTQGNEQ